MKFVTSMVVISIILPVAIYMLSIMLYMRTCSVRHKSTPFECGFDPSWSARVPFSTRFFLLAIIFIVFDIEVVLLLSVPLITYKTPSVIMGVMVIIVILFIGLIHEWNEGSIDWSY